MLKCPTYIVGDLNCSDIDWVNCSSPADGVQDAFLDFAVVNGFVQSVAEPTRGANILDIVLTNEPLTLADVQVNEPFANSDHCTVCFSVFMDTCNKNLSQTDGMRIKCYSWKNINVDGMVAYLTRIDRQYILSLCLTPDDLWSAFKNVLLLGIESNVLEVCGSTRTRRYGSGTGTKSTVRVYPFLPVKNTIFHDVGAISNVFFISSLLGQSLLMIQGTLSSKSYTNITNL